MNRTVLRRQTPRKPVIRTAVTPRNDDRISFMLNTATKRLLILNGVFAFVYFLVLTFAFQHGNIWLFGVLIAGEIFHLQQIIGYCSTVWRRVMPKTFNRQFNAPVNIFITVCGEPVNIVRQTAVAAKKIRYPGRVSIHLLNDGFVADRDNWRDIELLAAELGIDCITRRTPGGAKAGNINNALRQTKAPFFVVFDADHVPHQNFLLETMGYFEDPRLGFVQTPQFYKNYHENGITRIAWEQQTLFFGPIMSGKNRTNSAFMCGTNMVIRRQAILEAGGMCEFNIAEDFLTSLFIHNKGWKSVYVPKVLAEGLAPEDFLNYYKQQFRWTRGSLEVIFKYNPLFMRGLSWGQRLQYLTSASYYLSGVVMLADALLPLIYLFTGTTAVVTSTMTLALIFMPYIFLNLYTLQRTSGFSYSFEAISFSLSSFYLQIKAIFAVLLGRKTSFTVTSKTAAQGNFLKLVIPQIGYILLAIGGVIIGIRREGLSASLVANLAWASVNVAVFIPFIYAAAPKNDKVVRVAKILRIDTRPVRLQAVRLYEFEKRLYEVGKLDHDASRA